MIEKKKLTTREMVLRGMLCLAGIGFLTALYIVFHLAEGKQMPHTALFKTQPSPEKNLTTTP